MNTCEEYLRQQGEVVREERRRRALLAARLGMTEERLDRLVAASALQPDIGWAP